MTPQRWLFLATAVAAIGLATAVPPAHAESPSPALDDFNLSSWTEANGLPAGRIRDLTQDAAGYLWIASDGGLVRFDGLSFELWNARLTPSLPSGPAGALLTTADGSLWIGLSGKTPVGRIRGSDITLFGKAEGMAPGYTRSLVQDHAGVMWTATSTGLYWLEAGRWRRVTPADGLPDGATLAAFEDSAKRMWVGTTTAIYRRKASGKRFERIDTVDVSSNLWQTFSEDTHGRVFASDFTKGFRTPGGEGPASAKRGWGATLLHDRRGNFWVGTLGQGLWLQHRDGEGASDRSWRAATVNDGLISNAVQSLYEDRDGNIWLGTLAGLQRLSPHRVSPIRDLPIPRNIAATQDGSVWVGTTAGLTRFTAAGRRDYTEADGLPGSLVFALQDDGANGVWLSTERGLSHFDGHRFSSILTGSTESTQRIVGIIRSPDGLWLRDFGLNLFEWHEGKMRPLESLPDGFARSALAAFVDGAGRLWLGSADGTVAVRDGPGTFRVYSLALGRVLSFHESDDAIWVGGDEGLVRISPAGMVRLSRRNGLVGSVKSLTTDRHGRLWVGAGGGLARFERAEIEAVANDPDYRPKRTYFTAADGLAGVPYSEGSTSSVRAADGRLWFVTTTGVTVVNPEDVGGPRDNPSPVIEALAADSVPQVLGKPLDLPSRTAHLQFAFGAPAVTDPLRVRFRYLLEGFDRDWVDAGSTRTATYARLPARAYRFRVAATNGDGVWSEDAALAFSVAPAFTQTRMFYALLACIAALSVLGTWRLHVRRVRREFAMVLAERVRLGRALHDTLLQGLAGMALQVDDVAHQIDVSPAKAKERLTRVRWQVEDYIRRARHSIWELRSPLLDSNDLSRALRRAAEEAVGERAVELSVFAKGEPTSGTPIVKENLVFIGQEAVSNAVRHGSPSRVTVTLDYQHGAVRLAIEDDGCGFEPHDVPGHYGLTGMRERAEHLRGRLTIDSAPGRGTRVETVVPIH
jgi:signal transduction histidine kinase/ligand-binding sensor domain-containing protein